jgi:catechol 2,3-dioxygenase-like lactoylglutathione lyase family enzyme
MEPSRPRLGLVILAVPDLETGHRFYAQAFGWPVAVHSPGYVEFRLPEAMRLGSGARGADRGTPAQPRLPARLR